MIARPAPRATNRTWRPVQDTGAGASARAGTGTGRRRRPANVERRLACQYGARGTHRDPYGAQTARSSRSVCRPRPPWRPVSDQARRERPPPRRRCRRRAARAVVSRRAPAIVRRCRVVGEAASGKEAVTLIEKEQPTSRCSIWQMPELDGIGVVRMLKKEAMPLIAFVTAYDEYAVRAFEVNAVDYLLKPVEKARLAKRSIGRRSGSSTPRIVAEQASRVGAAIDAYETARSRRISSGSRFGGAKKSCIVPVQQIASIVADGELLHITTVQNERHTITYRLKDLERRLDPGAFIRLGRGTLANIDSSPR